MAQTLKILLIAHNEICYNPRLAKAADFFTEKNQEVTVFNPITGAASQETYQNFLKKRNWEIQEFDISKRSIKAKFNWVVSGITNKVINWLWCNINSKIGFNFYLNKGLLGFKANKKFDIIIVHVIDSLPFAARLKRKFPNSKLIFDSQEYFKGQYSDKNKCDRKWVETAEKKNIFDCDIVITTTNVMKERLISDYHLKMPVIRVRNTTHKIQDKYSKRKNQNVLKLVWVGNIIFYKNRRGLHILLEAIYKTKANVIFYIQGNIDKTEKTKIETFTKSKHIYEKVKIIDAVPPDDIVNSLKAYDIGLIGELPQEDNQRLTSSNKLFDYIAAGLAVIAPNLPGIAETSEEYKTGLLYEPGNSIELAKIIDLLYSDSDKLNELQKNSKQSHIKYLYWNFDYNNVWNEIQKLF